MMWTVTLWVVLMMAFALWSPRTARAAPPLPEAGDDPSGTNFWTYRGPQYNSANGEAPNVIQLLVDPADPNIIYAGTNQGVYRSTDGGENWEPRNGGLGGYGDLVVSGLALDPSDHTRLIIGTWGYGVFESEDSGETWVRLTDPLQSAQASASGVDVEAPPPIRAGGSSYEHNPALVPPAATSGGHHVAQPQGLPRNLSWTPVRRVSLHPNNPDTLFACIDNGHGVYQSVDAGATWSRIDLASGSSAYAYVFAPTAYHIRYAAFSGDNDNSGLYRTENGGTTWAEVGSGVITRTVFSVVVHPTNTDVVLAGTQGAGLYRSANGGDSWQRVSPEGGDTYFYTIAFAPSDPNIVYAGGYSYLYRSEDGGQTWTVADTTLAARYMEALALHPQAPDTVWVGAQNYPYGGVYKRVGTGSTFALKPYGMEDTFVLDLAQDPNNANVLYAATWGAGVFRSTDGGSTWTMTPESVSYVYTIEAADGPTGTILYAGTFYSNWGILRSYDQGTTWEEVSWSYPSYISFDLSTIYGDPDRLVAATMDGIAYSYDRGETWYNSSGLDAGVVQRLCEFSDSGRMLAATYGGGLFYSWGGYSWYEANAGRMGLYSEYTYDVACSSDVPGLAYAGSLGLYRTLDYGETWHRFDTGLPNHYVRALAIVPGTGDVFAGMSEDGVYLSPQGMGVWSDISDGLIEKRIRSLEVVGTSPERVFAGTNGLSAWDYTLTSRPSTMDLYLPLVSQVSSSASTCGSYESNDTFGTAYALPGPGTYCSYISDVEDEDVYSIDVTTLGPITVTLTQVKPGENYDLEFYRSDYQRLAGSWWSGYDDRVVFHPTQTGRYYIRVYAVQNSVPDQTYALRVTYNGAQGSGQICGGIVEDVTPVASAPLVLYYGNGYRSLRIGTQSKTDGSFCFYGMASLPVGHYYRVYYPNYEYDNARLAYWYCDRFTEYTSGSTETVCLFDADNVDLLSPSPGVATTLPVTFTWSTRGITGEQYQVYLRQAESPYAWHYTSLSTTGSAVVETLPSGFSYGTQNWWSVNVYNDMGYGGSYYMRSITFNSAQQLLAPLGQDAGSRIRSGAPREAPNAAQDVAPYRPSSPHE
jgi:photosystem II stability/assembly factor-like uncharacterized protein